MTVPAPRQAPQGARDGEEALLVAHLSPAAALRACLRARAARRARPVAVVARLLPRHLQRRLGAGRRILERDRQVVTQIGAPARPPPLPARSEDVPEPENVPEVAEDVVEVAERGRIEAGAPGAGDSRVTELVVARPLVRIGEHAVRLGGFLEAFLRGRVVRIPVRVVLQRQLAVRALQLLLADAARDAEHLVVVALAHALATLTMAARSSSSSNRYPRRTSSMMSPSPWPSLAW